MNRQNYLKCSSFIIVPSDNYLEPVFSDTLANLGQHDIQSAVESLQMSARHLLVSDRV